MSSLLICNPTTKEVIQCFSCTPSRSGELQQLHTEGSITFFTPDDMLRHWGPLSILISLSTVTYLDFSPRMTGFSNRVFHVECVVDRLKMLPYLLRTLGFPLTNCRFNNASSSHIIRDCISSYFCRTRGLHLTAALK